MDALSLIEIRDLCISLMKIRKSLTYLSLDASKYYMRCFEFVVKLNIDISKMMKLFLNSLE